MADNLKITTPINTSENITKIRQKEISDIPVIDPTRVGSRSEQQSSGQKNIDYDFNQQSVYNKFLQQFQGTANLNSTMKKIFFDAFLRQNISDSQNNLDNLLSAVASKFQMENPAEMSQQIKYLQENNTKFSADFFEMLRNISAQAKQNNGNEFQVLLGQFLKSYDNFMSSEHTLNAIIFTCRNLSLFMRRTSAQQMNQYIDQLESLSQKPIDAAVILKKEIIPFLGKNINSTGDPAKVRNMITLIVHNLARLNTGSIEHVENHFSNLIDYCRYNLNLSNAQLKLIESAYEQAVNEPHHKENEYFQTFIEVLKNGISDNRSEVGKAIYKDIANALLLDQNTFMPLTHIFLPVNYNGAFMFSEIWIDKQQEDVSSSGEYQTNKNLRLFLTFDIQNLGYFETVIQISGKNVEVILNYPASLKNKNKEIKDTVNTIFSNQGFDVKNITASAGSSAQKLDIIFPNIYERKQSVNVSI